MKSPEQAWNRLTAAARRAPDERDLSAPYGFAARVAAQAMDPGHPRISLLEHFSLRALGVACLVAVVAVAANYSAIARLFHDQTPPSDDPIAEMVDLAS